MDDVIADEGGALACTVFRVFQAALPFQYRPAREVVLRESGEIALKSIWPSPSERNRPGRSIQSW